MHEGVLLVFEVLSLSDKALLYSLCTWSTTFLKQTCHFKELHFWQETIGQSVYYLLPGVVGNLTFLHSKTCHLEPELVGQLGSFNIARLRKWTVAWKLVRCSETMRNTNIKNKKACCRRSISIKTSTPILTPGAQQLAVLLLHCSLIDYLPLSCGACMLGLLSDDGTSAP